MQDLTEEQIEAELAAIEGELNRRRYLADPPAWVAERMKDTIWSGQQKIMRALATHRKVAIQTCHGIGKSFIAAEIAAWWLDTHNPGEAFVVTTAPTGPQVQIILWKEIGRVHARGLLPGRVNQVEWLMKVNGKEEIVALGRKPSDYSPTAFQGIHAPYVLVIVDEANGVRGVLWDAMDSLIANDNSKMFTIFNPDDPSGEMYEAAKPGSDWHVLQFSAFDTPNFTGEDLPKTIKDQLIGKTYVEEKRKKWARSWIWEGNRVIPPPDGKLEDTHPFWQSKVLGQFPVQTSAGSLIPLTWIRQAQQRKLTPTTPSALSLDVGASEDGDSSCCGWARGPVFRILYEEREPDTMKTAGKFFSYLNNARYSANVGKIDYIGVGRGVVDRGKEQGFKVKPITVSMESSNPREFENLLAEAWWCVRGMFERGEIDIDEQDEELAEQLLMVRWEPNSKGQTRIVYADGPSPNRADALMLSYCPFNEIVVEGSPAPVEKESVWTGYAISAGTSRSRWRV